MSRRGASPAPSRRTPKRGASPSAARSNGATATKSSGKRGSSDRTASEIQATLAAAVHDASLRTKPADEATEHTSALNWAALVSIAHPLWLGIPRGYIEQTLLGPGYWTDEVAPAGYTINDFGDVVLAVLQCVALLRVLGTCIASSRDVKPQRVAGDGGGLHRGIVAHLVLSCMMAVGVGAHSVANAVDSAVVGRIIDVADPVSRNYPLLYFCHEFYAHRIQFTANALMWMNVASYGVNQTRKSDRLGGLTLLLAMLHAVAFGLIWLATRTAPFVAPFVLYGAVDALRGFMRPPARGAAVLQYSRVVALMAAIVIVAYAAYFYPALPTLDDLRGGYEAELADIAKDALTIKMQTAVPAMLTAFALYQASST